MRKAGIQSGGPGIGQADSRLDSRSSVRPTRRVEIYVSAHCFVCEYSHEIAALIRQEFPEVDVRVLDFADPATQLPEQVFATPTYLLDGKVWSLGNPSPEQVRQVLSSSLA